MRSMWKGSLGFGMVAIPVKLYGATDDKKISMNQLHAECGSRIKMPRHCPQCDDRVIAQIHQEMESDEEISSGKIMELVGQLNRGLEPAEIVKGYPIDKERYVPITPEEMEMLPLNSLKSIQVDAFIPIRTIENTVPTATLSKGRGEVSAYSFDVVDPRYFKDCYLLSPEEVGAKAFVLFVKAMENAGVMGVAKIAIREREQLCAVRPFNGLLLLQTLHWGDELRDYGELIPFASVSEEEMEMAGKLIGGMTREVDLASYKDDYRAALVEMISAKLEGKTIEAPKAPPKQDADLAKQLLASLNAMEPAK